MARSSSSPALGSHRDAVRNALIPSECVVIIAVVPSNFLVNAVFYKSHPPGPVNIQISASALHLNIQLVVLPSSASVSGLDSTFASA